MEMLVPQLHVLWDGLLQITGYMAILYSLIGWPCFVGLAVMVLTAPIQGVVVQKLFGLNRTMVKYTDERVRATNEALQGIQSVKMFAWETNFANMVNKSRQQELSTLRRVAFLRGFSRAFISALPGLVAAASFVVYALTNTNITASTLFAALVAFDQLRFPLLFYPMALANLAQASVSAGRLQKFLEMSEIDDRNIGSGIYERKQAVDGKIVLEKATVYWNDPSVPLENSTVHSKKSDTSDEEDDDANSVRYPKPILKDVSFTVETGKLCAVVGRVASGKSTLASAILGEALLESGTISLQGRTAYAAQSPWILNASLRDNILFGRPYDRERYEKVIDVCQLGHDLAMLDNGDLTEIGEKGRWFGIH
jgi:ATP-binding cassette, subfamily C (CFTR/MRP), member 1